MTRVGTRLLAAFAAALLAAALLSACGGSGSSSESTGAETSIPTSKAEANAKLEEKVKELKGRREKEAANKSSEGSSGSKGSQNVAAPLKVSGGGSGQFRTKGGDNSIQNYGDEGDESELQEVAEIVHGFYVARAKEEWAKACSYLAKGTVEQLEQLGQQSPQFKGKGCAPILKAFTRPLPASVDREVTYVDAASFRHNPEQGFLIYRGPGKTVYAMPLRNEDGTWRVAGLSGSEIG